MLNFDQIGIPIALIRDSEDELEGEIIYYDNGQHTKKRKMLYDSDSDSESDNEDEKYFCLEEGHFIPIPSEKQRECILVAGMSGSGKTTWAAEYAKTYKALFPNRDLLIFSRCNVKNDPAFKGINITQVEINEEILKNPVPFDIEKELKNPCLIIFDDITTIQNAKLKKVVEKLVSDCLEVGRKKNIHVIFCNHLLIDNDKGLARTVLHEIDKLVVFPQSGNPQQIKYVLQKYFEFTDKQCKKIMKTTSRWLCVSKQNSKLILTEYECYIPIF